MTCRDPDPGGNCAVMRLRAMPAAWSRLQVVYGRLAPAVTERLGHGVNVPAGDEHRAREAVELYSSLARHRVY